jgi:hypothetical protein
MPPIPNEDGFWTKQSTLPATFVELYQVFS